MLEPEIKEEFVELRAQGMSFAAIAERLQVAKSTLILWAKDMEMEIGNLRQIHTESLREKYRLGAERRLELFAKKLDAVEGELSKRDLTTVSTEHLFDLSMKLGRELAADASLNFRRRGGSTGYLLDMEDLAPICEWRV